MQGNPYISASCVISKNAAYKNNRRVFEHTDCSPGDFLVAAYRHFDYKYPKFYKMDSLSKLGWLTAEILLQDSFDAKNYLPGKVGLILANASSSLDTDIKYYETIKDIPSPALFVYTLPNIMTGEISIRHNFKGENAFFVFEKFDAGFIQQYVKNLFNIDTLQACVCGWVELLEDQYKSVMILAENSKPDGVKTSQANIFTTKNILKIYHSQNG